uniref:Vacuolar protein sorting-associated protein 72 homolog n=1 Tax=Astyanax mexicanus TaxID=7994 RepID=W5LJQ3_ASTMX
MSLAQGREQRCTAGNRMGKLLDAEEEDDFYKTTYGGFNDESGDDEYRGDHSDTEDEVDSDFDIDEGDEPDSNEEDDAPRRKSRVVTKAYKEPVKAVKPKVKRPSEEPKRTERLKPEKRSHQDLQEYGELRKSVRKSTSEHTRKTFERLQERQQEAPRRRKANTEPVLSQEELLKEAQITAQSNLQSLENYERLEADKKKHVHKKRRFEGPTVRYHSEENVDVEGLDQDTPQSSSSSGAVGTRSLCSRTFITFSDDEAFRTAFPQVSSPDPALPVQEVCPVTHKPALYRDPVTDIPYSDSRAFRIIREAYRKYISAHGFPGNSDSTQSAGGSSAPAKTLKPKTLIKQGLVTA